METQNEKYEKVLQNRRQQAESVGKEERRSVRRFGESEKESTVKKLQELRYAESDYERQSGIL